MKRYAILKLPPQDHDIYFVVETTCEDDESTEYMYEEHTCPPDIFRRVEKVIIAGDTDPHGMLWFVRTVETDLLSRAHDDGDWAAVIPEAFPTTSEAR